MSSSRRGVSGKANIRSASESPVLSQQDTSSRSALLFLGVFGHYHRPSIKHGCSRGDSQCGWRVGNFTTGDFSTFFPQAHLAASVFWWSDATFVSLDWLLESFKEIEIRLLARVRMRDTVSCSGGGRNVHEAQSEMTVGGSDGGGEERLLSERAPLLFPVTSEQ